MTEVTSMSARINFRSHLLTVFREDKKLKTDEHKIHTAIKGLEQFSKDELNKKYERNKDSPKKLEKIMYKIVDKFFEYTTQYMSSTTDTLKQIRDMAVQVDRQKYENLMQIKNLIERWYNAARSPKDKALYTTKIVEDLLKEYRKLYATLESEIGGDKRDMQRMAHNKKPHVGFTTRIKSINSLMNNIRKIAKRRAKKMTRAETRLLEEMNKQLNTTTNLSFPAWFIKYIKEEADLEILFHKITNDLKEIMYYTIKMNDEVVSNANQIIHFLAQFQNAPTKFRGEHDKLRVEYNKIVTEIHEILKTEWQDDQSVDRITHVDMNEFGQLINVLKYKANQAEMSKGKYKRPAA